MESNHIYTIPNQRQIMLYEGEHACISDESKILVFPFPIDGTKIVIYTFSNAKGAEVRSAFITTPDEDQNLVTLVNKELSLPDGRVIRKEFTDAEIDPEKRKYMKEKLSQICSDVIAANSPL